MPALRGGHCALPRLISVPVDEFASQYWGSTPLLSRAADLPRGFDDLFAHDAVDELVSERGLRTPFLRVAKNGATLPDRAFTAGGGTGATIADQVSDDKLLHLFADGATIVLQGLHRTWSPVTDFTQQLAEELGHPVQVNAYVTPPQNTGFNDHYDVHDVFVLQIAGDKRWRIRPPVHLSPLRDEPWTDHRAAVEAAATQPPLLEVTLRPGDCLYLPRGFLHAATALGDVSTHLTIGVHPWTRRHVADELMAQAIERASTAVEVRASLPLGVDLGDASALEPDVEQVRAALIAALRDLDADDLVPALTRRDRGSSRPGPVAPVAQVRAAARLDDGSRLVLRAHLAARIEEGTDGSAVLSSRAGTLTLAAPDVAVVRELLDTHTEEGVAVSALGLDLARQLVLGGVLLPA